jgi:cobalt chelatase family protein/4Fe-4S binding protein
LQALIIIAHGSPLDADAGAAVHRCADAIRETGAFDEVRACFRLEEPSLREVFDLIDSAEVFVVPLVSSDDDLEEVIKRELGLPAPPPSGVSRAGKTIRCCAPVDPASDVVSTIMQRVADARALEIGNGSADADRGSHASAAVAEARRALVAWVDEAGDAGRIFLQARLLAKGEGRYEIRHRRDVHRSLQSLEWVSRDPYFAREIAQATNRGEHRPLKTSPNLKQGWALIDLDADGLWTALDHLYPACAAHWHAGRTGTLRVTHWREAAERQIGDFAGVRELGDESIELAARACCADAVCLRRVAWDVDEMAFLGSVDEGPVDGDAAVPCPEACAIFLALARELVRSERAPRRDVPGLGAVNAEELAQLRAITSAAAAGTLGRAREGDFADPTNLRRMRYLAARLDGA